MAFRSESFWDNLSDAWDDLRPTDRDVINAVWDRFLEIGAHDLGDIIQVDLGKSLDTVQPLYRSFSVAYEFNDDNKNTVISTPVGFPEAYDVDPRTRRIPQFRDKAEPNEDINEEVNLLVDQIDFVVDDGTVFFAEEPPEFLVADLVEWDRSQVQDNFGSLVGFTKDSDADYLQRIKALWYALWHGPTVANTELALSVPLGFPITPPGEVLAVTDDGSGGNNVTILLEDDTRITINVPSPLQTTVEEGDVLQCYAALSNGIEVSDLITDPGFTQKFGLHETQEFFSAVAVVNGEFITTLDADGVTIASNILGRIKPTYVNAFLGIEVKLEEAFSLVASTQSYNTRLVATDSLIMNYVNYMRLPDFESAVLDESTYESVPTERRTFDLNSDTIGVKDRLTIRDYDTGTILRQD